MHNTKNIYTSGYSKIKHRHFFFLPGVLEEAIKFLFRRKALGLLEKQVEQVGYTGVAYSPEIKSSSDPQ